MQHGGATLRVNRGPAATVTDSSAHTVGESGKPSSENQPSPFHRPIVHSLSSPGLSRHGPKYSPGFTGAEPIGAIKIARAWIAFRLSTAS
jgi:hypothetical protein